MLCRPTLLCASTIVVRPDDLVLKTFPPEYLVQHHLAIVDFPVVDVKEERPCGTQNPIGLVNSGSKEPHEVVKAIGVLSRTELFGSIRPASKANAITAAIILYSPN